MNRNSLRIYVALASILLIASGLSQAFAADTYTIDPMHSFYMFRVGHLGSSFVYGRFNEGSGEFVVDEADASKNSIKVEIKTASVDTGVPARDSHLKTKDFFDVEKYPTMTFKSSAFKKIADGSFDVTGDLTIHGVTKQITAKANFVGKSADPKMGPRAGWEASFTIDRQDFGMKTMVGPVGAEIKITIAVEGKKA